MFGRKLSTVLCTLATAAMLQFASTVASAAGAATQPNVCSRACWGARSTSLSSNMAALNRAIIHHTGWPGQHNVSSIQESMANVRAVQNLHIDTRGWRDVGYHFLIDSLGNSFEGRRGSLDKSKQYRGAHDDNNTNSFGFSCLGNYHWPTYDNLTAAEKNALYNIIAWRMPNGWSPYGESIYSGRMVGYVDGHRDVKGTECPGDNIYNTIIGSNHYSGEARAQIAARINGTAGGGSFAAGPKSITYGDRMLDVFYRGTGNKVYQKYFRNAWLGLNDLGGNSSEGIAACTFGPGTANVFIRYPDGTLRERYYRNGDWSNNWGSLGGGIKSGPDAVSWADGRVDVVAVGTGGNVVHKWFDSSSGGWVSFWENMGGSNLVGDPAISSRGANKLDLFVIGESGDLVAWKYFNGSAWIPGGAAGSWYHIDANNLIGIDAVSWSSDRIDLVAVNENGDVLHKYWDTAYGSTWLPSGSWENLGSGVATSAPTISSMKSGRLDIFVRGTDGKLKQKLFNGSWSGWIDLGHNMQ